MRHGHAALQHQRCIIIWCHLPQLLQWQKRISAPPASDELRMYQVAPQSQWAPGFLVARAAGDGGRELLDTRGAFLLHTADGVCIWKVRGRRLKSTPCPTVVSSQGKQCPPQMMAAAEVLAAQLVRYEHPGAPVHTVPQGEEPSRLQQLLDAASAQAAAAVKDAAKAAAEAAKRAASYDAAYKVCAGG